MTASLRESLAPTVARGAEAPLKPDCSAVFGDALVTLGLPMSHWAQRRCGPRGGRRQCDEEARSLGVRTEAVKAAVVAAVTLMTAAAVAVSGIIGWVGLVIPHAARMLVGPDHRRLLPASFALGASYLLLIDDLARTISTQEVPIGILTALIGAPFFAVLLRRTGAGWQ